MSDNHLLLRCEHIDQLHQIAGKIISFAGDEKVWLFYGTMGAGKTTLIKAICEVLGIQDLVNSPTFALVNEYHNEEKRVFYHFDFYRINDPEEALNIGVDEYFYSGKHCFIEWPSRIEALIPENNIRIDIKVNSDHSRSIYLQKT